MWWLLWPDPRIAWHSCTRHSYAWHSNAWHSCTRYPSPNWRLSHSRTHANHCLLLLLRRELSRLSFWFSLVLAFCSGLSSFVFTRPTSLLLLFRLSSKPAKHSLRIRKLLLLLLLPLLLQTHAWDGSREAWIVTTWHAHFSQALMRAVRIGYTFHVFGKHSVVIITARHPVHELMHLLLLLSLVLLLLLL